VVTGKVFHAALLFSMIAHAALVVGAFPWRWPGQSPAGVPDDYIFIGLEAPPAPPPAFLRRSNEAAKRANRPEAAEQPSRHPEAAEGRRRISAQRSFGADAPQDDESFAPQDDEAAPDRVSGKGAATSQQLLSDPKNGRIFSEYFQSVKSRIQTVAARHQKFIVRENGKVEIDFVLGPRGNILVTRPNPRSPGARDPLLATRALDIIRESAPFSPFPREIEATSVSFNITLVFDG